MTKNESYNLKERKPMNFTVESISPGPKMCTNSFPSIWSMTGITGLNSKQWKNVYQTNLFNYEVVQQHSWKLPNETQTSPQFMNNVTMPQQMIYCLTSTSTTHTTPMYPLLIQLSPVRSCCPHKESHPFWSLYPPNTFLGKHCIECILVPLKTS